MIVDTHSHLLPGLDDGPRSTGGALEMAAELASLGVGAVLCTPHFSRQYPVERDAAVAAAEKFRAALRSSAIPLRIEVAAELSPANAVSAPLDDLEARSVRGYAIVELLPDTPAPFLATVTERLGERGLRPVVAHPELARSIHRQPELLDDVRAAGGLVQVLAPGLSGFWGEEVATSARELVGAGRADLLGSDAHGRRRPVSLFAHALDLVARRFGSDVVRDLTERGPALLMTDDALSPR